MLLVDCVLVVVGCWLCVDGFGFEMLMFDCNGCVLWIDDICWILMCNVWVIGDVVGELMFVYCVMV